MPVFDTKLMGIKGVAVEPAEEAPSDDKIDEPPAEDEATPPTEETPEPTPEDEADTPEDQPQPETPGSQNGECRLLGPFALFVQGALGALALLSLVFKRWRERPRRPMKIFVFDASKQVVGSILTHILNLGMSEISSGRFSAQHKASDIDTAASDSSGSQPNPCSFYLLNLGLDVSPLSSRRHRHILNQS